MCTAIDAEAFATRARARSRVLVDVFRSGRTPLGSLSAEEAARDEQFQIRLASLNAPRAARTRNPERPGAGLRSATRARKASASPPSATRVRLEYERFRTNLYASHTRLKLERGETNALTIDEALALSRARQSAIVEFVVTETTAYAFLLDGERPEAWGEGVRAADHAEGANRAVNSSSQRITNRDVAFPAWPRRSVSRAARRRRARAAAWTQPDCRARWRALAASVSGADGAGGSCVIYDRVLTYAPSVSALRLMATSSKRHHRAATRLLAFGNPAWDGASTPAQVGRPSRRYVHVTAARGG